MLTVCLDRHLLTSSCVCVASIQAHEATHPDSKLHVLPTIDLHAFIQQADLLKVLPVSHKATNQSRAPEREHRKQMKTTARRENASQTRFKRPRMTQKKWF